MKRLEGKVALITGAARGIGAAIASAFVEQGAFVFFTDINDESGEVVTKQLGANARYLNLNVCQESDWINVTQKILDEKRTLNIIVNNAGVAGFENSDRAQEPDNATLEDWHRVHRINLDGVFLGCKHGIQVMRQSRSNGSIINISSRSGVVGIPGAAAYASSKAAIRNHTKTVALYCAEQRLSIRCNSIHPAAILTPMWDPLLGDGPDREIRMK